MGRDVRQGNGLGDVGLGGGRPSIIAGLGGHLRCRLRCLSAVGL